HFAHGELVDGLPILVDEVHLLVDGLVGRRAEAAACGQVEAYAAGAVDLVHVIDHADLAFFAGLDEHGSAAVAEEDAGGAVGVVGHAGVGVGAADQDHLVRTAFDHLDAGLEREDEAGAAARNVESPGVRRADLMLYQAGGGGEHHVWRDRADDDAFDGFRADAAGS